MAEQDVAEEIGKGVEAKAPAKPVERKAEGKSAPSQQPMQAHAPAVRVIQYPIATEKAVSGIEVRNEITLVVSMNATKKQVLAEAEKMFGAKVTKVRTAIQMGRKKAILKFAKAGTASDVAAKLKIV